jgi:quercetin dioxygenase-like cupin family protein
MQLLHWGRWVVQQQGSWQVKRQSKAFMFGAQTPKETVGDGLIRQIFGYDNCIMMARVEFDLDAVGAVHAHPHSQVTYVESGEFDVTIDGVETRLGPGDSFYVAPGLDHGAVCRRAGVLIDVFSPVREDFLDSDAEELY